MNSKKEQILHQIADEIKKHLEQQYDEKSRIDWGLYTGLLGLIIYLFYYARWIRKDTDTQYADSCLEYYLDNVPLTQMHYSYCSGLSGVLVGLNHLNTHQFAEISLTNVLPALNNYIVRLLKLDIHNHDFMHGAIGLGIMGSVLKCKEIHNVLLSELFQRMIVDEDTMWLTFKVFNEPQYIENISMSHGMSSVVSYLSMLSVTEGPYKTKVQVVLKKCINYLKSQLFPNYQEIGSYFPYTSLKDSICKSRLAWCYGDLGVALAIFNAGLLANEKDWKDLAIQILSDSTQRLNTPDNSVVDACFCHGSAGISQIYNRLYLETQMDQFNIASEYWVNETLKYSKHPDGLAGYKTATGNSSVTEYSLLEGIAGIGLSILSSSKL